MSGIYIPGMEMPVSCCECFAFKSNASGNLFCKAKCVAFGREDAEWLPKKTPNWCPLVPVPDHGRLLKVLKTERECVSRNCDRNCGVCDLSLERDEILGAFDTLIFLLDAPTIIPASMGHMMRHYCCCDNDKEVDNA